MAPAWLDSAFAGGRVALVVGNSAYQNAPALPNPAKDAQSMAAKLKEAGFEVVSARDLGNLQFKRAIREFEDKAADADVAVVFYAGHGMEIRGGNYMIPVDARLASDRDAEDEAITLDRLVESVEGAKGLALVILDACRDNPFNRTMKRTRAATLRAVTAGLSIVEPINKNTLIAYAAKAGSAAEDGASEHSPFTNALLTHLFVPGLDIRLAFGRVRDEVVDKTRNRQEPYVSGSLGGAHISIVNAPEAAAANAPGEKSDYSLVEKIGTKGAWEVFLTQHPNGFYADLARQQLAKLAALEPGNVPTMSRTAPEGTAVATLDTKPASPPPGPSTEERRAWDRIKDSSNAAALRDFIKRYPSSPLANTAQTRLEAIEREAQERELKARAEREAKAAEEAKVKAEREAVAKRAEEERVAKERAEREAKAAEAARQKAERETKAAEEARQKAEREAAAKRAEEERTAKLAEAARAKQEQATREKVEREERDRTDREAKAAEVARQKAEQQSRTAEEARQKAEREAAAKRAEEERVAKLAETARAAQEQAARERAERAAKAAEAEREKAERETAAKRAEEKRATQLGETTPATQDACGREEDVLNHLKAHASQGWAREDLRRLSEKLTCERLRPNVLAALEAAQSSRNVPAVTAEPSKPAVNTRETIRSAQRELVRIGCLVGEPDGVLGGATAAAVKRYQVEQGRSAGEIEITDSFVSELRDKSARVCPLLCPTGKVADGEQCIAARPSVPAGRQKIDEEPDRRQKAKQEEPKQKPVVRQKDEDEKSDRRQRARQEEPQRARQEEPRPQPRVRQEAASPRVYGGGGGGGGGHGAVIGVGF